MRYRILFILSIIAHLSWAQGTDLGSATSLNIGSNVSLQFGDGVSINGIVINEGNAIIEGDVSINNTLENAGLFYVKGDGAVDAAASVANRAEASITIEGNASLDGIIVNNGEFLVLGDENTVLNGSMDNNHEMKLTSNLLINGTLNNAGTLDVTGDMQVAGTLANADGGEASIDGDLSLVSVFTNEGIIRTSGDASISDIFTNNNEAAFGGSAAFESTVTNSQNLLLGSSASFNGDLTNSGSIISVGDGQLNFGANKQLGTLSFVDIDGRDPIDEVVLSSSADSIFIENINLSTIGKVTLPPNFVLVLSSLNIEGGILNATNQETFLVQGSINVSAAGSTGTPSYVEGQMLAITTTGTTTFPMGINGSPNYVTIDSDTPGITVKVECKLPNPDSLLTDENTMGLAQDVEWTVQSLVDSAEVSFSVDYSGVDFTNIPNFINAREYDATLQRFQAGDSVFQALRTIESVNDNDGTAVPREGTIKTADKIWVTDSPVRLALGLSPVLTEPEVYLPNVFAPGAVMSDNKIFRPFIGGAVVSSVTFQVFDSFNREVYSEGISGEDLSLEELGWDGTLKSGLEAPEGVYYYKVIITYMISDDVSDQYFTSGERNQTQIFSKLGSVLLVK